MTVMGRREALRRLGYLPAAAALALAMFQQACRENGTTVQACDGVSPTMDLHQHPTCLTLAQETAGVDVVLTLQSGTTGHMHTVALTSADIAAIQSGTPVTVTSTVSGDHSHQVTFG